MLSTLNEFWTCADSKEIDFHCQRLFVSRAGKQVAIELHFLIQTFSKQIRFFGFIVAELLAKNLTNKKKSIGTECAI